VDGHATGLGEYYGQRRISPPEAGGDVTDLPADSRAEQSATARSAVLSGPDVTGDRRSAGRDDAGRVDRALGRLYDRRGVRYLLVAYCAAYPVGLLAGVVSLVIGGRFLGLSSPQVVSLLAVWGPIAMGLALVGTAVTWGHVRAIARWSGNCRTAALAPETWEALVRVRRAALAPTSVASLALLPFAVYIVIHYHRPWYLAITILAMCAVAVTGIMVLAASIADVLARPVLRDVCAHLAPEFEARTDGWRLRTKALTPLPVVTSFAGVTVGAYSNLSTNAAVRATLGVGVVLATVAVSSVIYLIINRSVLDPIGDLLAATRRVRAGDMATPVPVVTDDELGTLANSFNQMLAGLREREALRVELLAREEELRASRARIVAASDAERRRVERNIHDGAQQRLVALSLDLRMLEEGAATLHAEQLRAMAADAGANLKEALDELRELARGLHPSVLETDGLGPALRQLAARSPIPVTVSAPGGRLSEAIESTIYFVTSEALANVAKYARATHADVSVEQEPRRVTVQIADDGVGGAQAGPGSGLAGLADRVAALDGSLQIKSTPGSGTVVIAELPLNGGGLR
jgi:signal transduction histidine kinase